MWWWSCSHQLKALGLTQLRLSLEEVAATGRIPLRSGSVPISSPRLLPHCNVILQQHRGPCPPRHVSVGAVWMLVEDVSCSSASGAGSLPCRAPQILLTWELGGQQTQSLCTQGLYGVCSCMAVCSDSYERQLNGFPCGWLPAGKACRIAAAKLCLRHT